MFKSKVIYEKVKFSNGDFAIIFMIIRRYTCKLFKYILNDVQTKDNGDIIAV